MASPNIPKGYILPGQPHPLLAPEANPGYADLRRALVDVGQRIGEAQADLLMIYSTGWPSVIGHQIQALEHPEWVHVDQEWHDLGEIPYRFHMDVEFAEAYQKAATARGLHARTVAYHGFPIDTGTVTALKLINPDNAIKACVVSCNMYADRAETLVLGKAAADAIEATGRRAVPIAITGLSNRYHTEPVAFADDRIHSDKDDEWNRKLLQFLGEGRLEDVSQLAREFAHQANGDSKLKALWWLAALMGQTNDYAGEVLAYRPVYGTGAAVVQLTPGASRALDKEFDEEDVDVFSGNDNVLTGGAGPTQRAQMATSATPPPAQSAASEVGAPARGRAQRKTVPIKRDDPLSVPIRVTASDGAPAPVGAYPHARKVGHFLYLSGVGPRQAGSDAIPGGPIRDANGDPRDYDMAAQTRAALANVRAILEAAGSSMERVIDVTSFLIDMDRDFKTYNAVYAEVFGDIQPTRTTLAIQALPTPIAVEFKVVALTGDAEL